jgi:hypothetical protein
LLQCQNELPEVSSDIDDDEEEWEVSLSIQKDPQNLKAFRYEATIIRK